ncbi:MAG: carboxypeptidase-like regulatory domain-containing protein, partial [Bacteroidota bacterium]|nr:carboxypeptidase-like regulatory domain-containing protein [Bacteroidota bacterium]
DKGEPKASGLKVRINGGRTEHNKKDTSVIISGLEAYSNYYVEFDKNSFDNIGWQLRKSSMNIVIEPNNFKLVEVPVNVVGEAAGTVYSQDDKGIIGLGRIIVNFYNSDSALVARTITESDGYFSYVGLKPGLYMAKIDEAQLLKLNMTATPGKLPITIKVIREGDLVEGLKFIIKSNNNAYK